MADKNDFIRLYYELGLSGKNIQYVLAQRHQIIISERHLRRSLKALNLCRRGYSDLADVMTFIQRQLQGSGAQHGYRMMYAKCQENGLTVRKEDVRLILKELDPEGVKLRASRRLTRRSYFAKGPNFIWHFDGYDKLKHYGICISGCIDGYSRKIMWLNAYSTNNDPKVIGGYFVECVKECGGCPRIVRGDCGTENGHVKAFQQLLRSSHTDSLADRSYMDGASTKNQRIEAWWSILRKQCAQYWMELFQSLQEEGHFRGDILDKNLIQFCFMGLIQVINRPALILVCVIKLSDK